jgi:hypothetical protein
MIKLNELEKAMKGQFIWDRSGLKPMQVLEEYEGNKELARTIFVGLADMYGFDGLDVMEYVDCGYDSYRHKLSQFREMYKAGLDRDDKGELKDYDDGVTKFYTKVRLCLSAIKFQTGRNAFLNIENYISI